LEKSKERGDRKIFIEKPFGGHSNHETKQLFEDVYIGYVLRFNPCIQWIKEHILPSEVIKAKGQYLSYTLNNKPKGWRNGEFSGVLNEMGSHVIDLLNYLLGLDQYTVESKSLRSIVSDVDDEVSATLNSKGRSIELYFNWVKKEIRKPVFGIELELKDGRHVFVDQQVIRISQEGEIFEQISVTDLGVTVPFYLRGVDFTLQMQDLIRHNTTNCTMAEALKVNNIINDIIKA
jgi:predicted dehydrogenase